MGMHYDHTCSDILEYKSPLEPDKVLMMGSLNAHPPDSQG